jgi:hypothetical protein
VTAHSLRHSFAIDARSQDGQVGHHSAGAERGAYDGHETGDRSEEMNDAPPGSPIRGADSWRSLRAAHGLHLLLDPNLEY